MKIPLCVTHLLRRSPSGCTRMICSATFDDRLETVVVLWLGMIHLSNSSVHWFYLAVVVNCWPSNERSSACASFTCPLLRSAQKNKTRRVLTSCYGRNVQMAHIFDLPLIIKEKSTTELNKGCSSSKTHKKFKRTLFNWTRYARIFEEVR